MLRKFALCEITPMKTDAGYAGLVKTASGKVMVEPGSEKARIIESEIKKHPTALFFRAKAIRADEPNSNGDYFSKAELLGAYKSFEGVPFFTNHDNQNVENARGKIIHAEWDEEDNSVYTIAFVDREAFPHICRSIEEEYVTGVSMGALSGGSMILMSDLTEKPIEDINEGDVVLSHVGNPRKVKSVHNEYLGKSMYKLNISTYHRSPLFTDDHPILTIDKEIVSSTKQECIKIAQQNKYARGKGETELFIGQDGWRDENYDAKFKEAKNVSENDFVLIPSKFSLKDGESFNSDFYYLVGAFLGDGYLKKDKNGRFEGISFCLGLDEIELCSKIHSLIKKYSDSDPCDIVCENRNGIYVSVYDRKLAQWFSDNIGTGSKRKRIKFSINFIEDANQLLAGYLDTDGCIVDKTRQNVRGSKFGGFQISSSNIGLLEDIHQLIISLGHISRISTFIRQPSINSVVSVETIENTLAIGSNASSIFCHSLKYNSSSFDVAEIKAGKSFVTYINDVPFMACPVKSIEIRDFDEPVYDLTIEEDESYVADGIAVHNCSVEYSICNICGNKAEKTEDYCWHIRERKGRTFSGKAKDVRTGNTKDFKNEPVFEYNYGIKFIELSAVVDPACQSCLIEGLIPNDEYISKVANMQNTLYMIKTAALQKEAAQQEIDQLNQCLVTLEDISVQLIKNRQQVEVEFASDLVSILSELQKFTDELIGAGYGSVQSIPGVEDTPGAEGEIPMDNMGEIPIEATPVAAETPAQGVGAVSGSPTEPLVQTPQLPITAPAKPMAFDSNKIRRVASLVPELSNLRDKIYEHIGDEKMGKRRTAGERAKQKKVAAEVLSNLWKEKQDFFEYINKVPSVQDNDCKVSVKKREDSFVIVAETKGEGQSEQKVWTFEDLTGDEKKLVEGSPKEASLYFLDSFAKSLNSNIKEGENVMVDKIKEAGAKSVNKAPEVITEVQLQEQKDLYHARNEVEENSITEKQLADDNGSHQRTGEKEVITEVQLEEKNNKLNPRQDASPEVITEAQLETSEGASPCVGEGPEVITEKQLSDGGYTNPAWEKDVVTERQLDAVDTPWERAASRDASMFKSAGDHMNAVVDVIADSVISTGCTPEEACEVAASFVGSTKDRFEIANAILEASDDEDVDASKRLAFWSKKNIKVASAGSQTIAEAIVRGLRRVASDATINPEVIIDAIDVVTEASEGAQSISKRIDEKLEEAKEDTIKANKKSELKEALKAMVTDEKEERAEERKEIEASLDKEEDELTREAERALWEKDIETKKNPDTMIETNFEEVGVEKEASRDETFKGAIRTFARGALASQNVKMASVTNVTISGDTISIAVQTDDGDEAVEIPIGGDLGPIEEEVVPEGDLAGEGLEGALPPVEDVALASKDGKITKEAQSPMGGGVPGTPGEVAGGPGSPEAGLPGDLPGGEPVEALTMDETEVADEIPTAGEKQMPYAICPECGSSDVDIEKEAAGNVKGDCKACGAGYEALIKKAIEFTIIKPTRSVGEEGTVGEPEAPELPALPVAAQTKLDKGSLVRIASNREKYGHVCPACGMTECKTASEEDGHIEYACPACGTEVEKDVIVNVNNPDENHLRVKWEISPDVENCEGCVETAEKFASIMKVENMMKSASNGTTEFPKANCIERIARAYGGNSTATFGPCKGKPLADCVCNQLEKLGLTTVRHLERLASVYSQKDPMDECMEDQKQKGYEVKEAESICNCLKKKFASELDDNPFIQAFASDIEDGKEKILTAQDLGVINDLLNGVEEGPLDDEYVDVEIGDDLESLEDTVDQETVTLEVTKETAEELADAAAEASAEVEVEVEVEEEVPVEVEEVPEMGAATELEIAAESEGKEEVSAEEEKKEAMAMQTHKLRRVGEEVVKVAGTPKKVEDIEGNVDAGVPRAKGTLGNEGADNIDVPMAKPSVPRAKATMGNEGADNIDKPAGLPNVAVDSSYMGDEKAVQKDMPAINNEIKGTVIAEEEEKVVKEAKQLKEIDTVEDNVDAGVPRAKATMGEEGADNVDVPMAKPDVPRANAEMGNEGPDNINPKADGPDVPVDSAYMGQEKDVQKDMPEINDEILKNVQQSEKKDKQIERIANARKMKAVEVASKLLATNRIIEDAYEDVVEALSNFSIDKIASKADTMYPRTVKASAAPAGDVHAGPAIVLESKDVSPSNPTVELTDRIASQFTIGNSSFDEKLTVYGDK